MLSQSVFKKTFVNVGSQQSFSLLSFAPRSICLALNAVVPIKLTTRASSSNSRGSPRWRAAQNSTRAEPSSCCVASLSLLSYRSRSVLRRDTNPTPGGAYEGGHHSARALPFIAVCRVRVCSLLSGRGNRTRRFRPIRYVCSSLLSNRLTKSVLHFCRGSLVPVHALVPKTLSLSALAFSSIDRRWALSSLLLRSLPFVSCVGGVRWGQRAGVCRGWRAA